MALLNEVSGYHEYGIANLSLNDLTTNTEIFYEVQSDF